MSESMATATAVITAFKKNSPKTFRTGLHSGKVLSNQGAKSDLYNIAGNKGDVTVADMGRNVVFYEENQKGEPARNKQGEPIIKGVKPYYFNNAPLWVELKKYYEGWPGKPENAPKSLLDLFLEMNYRKDAREKFIKDFFVSKGIDERVVEFLVQTLNQNGLWGRLGQPVSAGCNDEKYFIDENQCKSEFYIFYDKKNGLEIVHKYDIKEAVVLDKDDPQLSPKLNENLQPLVEPIDLKTLTYSKIETVQNGDAISVSGVSTEYFVSAESPLLAKAIIQGVTPKNKNSIFSSLKSLFKEAITGIRNVLGFPEKTQWMPASEKSQASAPVVLRAASEPTLSSLSTMPKRQRAQSGQVAKQNSWGKNLEAEGSQRAQIAEPLSRNKSSFFMLHGAPSSEQNRADIFYGASFG